MHVLYAAVHCRCALAMLQLHLDYMNPLLSVPVLPVGQDFGLLLSMNKFYMTRQHFSLLDAHGALTILHLFLM